MGSVPPPLGQCHGLQQSREGPAICLARVFICGKEEKEQGADEQREEAIPCRTFGLGPGEARREAHDAARAILAGVSGSPVDRTPRLTFHCSNPEAWWYDARAA